VSARDGWGGGGWRAWGVVSGEFERRLAWPGWRSGHSQTDAINRAIQVYSYLADITETGGTLYVRDAGSDELERLRII
jgi:hypothetical protein